MRLFVIAIVLAVTSGCPDDPLAPMRAVKTEVCACKTAACADEAIKKVPPPAGSADHRAQKLAREIQDCLVKAYERDRPTTDPDAEKPADDTSEDSDANAATTPPTPSP